jgi:hypothetical protein
LQPRAKRLLHEVMYADTRERAFEAVGRFAEGFASK